MPRPPSYQIRQLERLLGWLDRLMGVAQLMWMMVEQQLDMQQVEMQQEMPPSTQAEMQQPVAAAGEDQEPRQRGGTTKEEIEPEVQRKREAADNAELPPWKRPKKDEPPP